MTPIKLEHPDITRTLNTGYPDKQPSHWGVDALGNEIFEGDHVLLFDGEIFLKDELSADALNILKLFGAVEDIAE